MNVFPSVFCERSFTRLQRTVSLSSSVVPRLSEGRKVYQLRKMALTLGKWTLLSTPSSMPVGGARAFMSLLGFYPSFLTGRSCTSLFRPYVGKSGETEALDSVELHIIAFGFRSCPTETSRVWLEAKSFLYSWFEALVLVYLRSVQYRFCARQQLAPECLKVDCFVSVYHMSRSEKETPNYSLIEKSS